MAERNAVISDQVSVGESLVAVVKRGESIRAIRTADSDGHAIAGDINDDGSAQSRIWGESRQGERGVLEVCGTLIKRLNREGANWGDPVDLSKAPFHREEGFDCAAYDGANILKVQVTRAVQDQHFWKTLGQKGRVSQRTETDAAAEALREAIESKVAKIARAQRKEIILALDATETAGQTFTPVVDSFRRRHAAWAVELGFGGIWIVGPNLTLTSRLDSGTGQ